MQLQRPEVVTRFPVDALVSRRSFIFARAGFGKSNLTKLLFSKLYEDMPTVMKRGGRAVPVGTVIFDPEGEYFWPDDKGRPGLADVPTLEDKLVVFTPRQGPSPFYESFVAGGVKLDIRRLKPADVIAIAVAPDRQDQQNVAKLRSLSQDRWGRLVDLIERDGHGADLTEIAELLKVESGQQQMEAIAARSNMATIVGMLHDKSSLLMDRLLAALSQGKLCVVDVSQMRGGQAMILSGLILRRIFERNQIEFTQAEPKTIPTIAVIEEAQTVLNERASAAEPYIAWVKEGRKYDLGSLMITQQPGSIPHEILSQGDNWFIFHLLSAGDLQNVKRANAHFSDDLLSGILNEPIPGQGVFWSSAGDQPYPIALRAFSFERMYAVRDPDYTEAPAETFASELKRRFDAIAGGVEVPVPVPVPGNGGGAIVPEPTPVPGGRVDESGDGVDVMARIEDEAITALERDDTIRAKLGGDGYPYGGLVAFFEQNLPELLEDRRNFAYNLVPKALNRILGDQNRGGWHTFKHPATDKRWVKAGSG
jgi:hypothetical protein